MTLELLIAQVQSFQGLWPEAQLEPYRRLIAKMRAERDEVTPCTPLQAPTTSTSKRA